MKKFSQSYLYWVLCGLCAIGIGKAFSASDYSNLFAFSHSLDIHADEERMKRDGQSRINSEANQRQQQEKDRRAAEDTKRYEEAKKKREEVLARVRESELKAQQETLKNQKNSLSKMRKA